MLVQGVVIRRIKPSGEPVFQLNVLSAKIIHLNWFEIVLDPPQNEAKSR